MSEQIAERKRGRVELILQELRTLPTLSPIAVRLLQLSSSEDATVEQIASLVESDPALSSRLLSMCRSAHSGLGASVTTVERAVVMLGLDAVRSALLSVYVYDLMERDGDEETPPPDGSVDRRALWRRRLAVACASELIAREHPADADAPKPEEAFTAGLLAGLGQLALEMILPRTYAQVVELASRRRIGIAAAERELIGFDHHTAGKRLGEHWNLPHAIQDVMWMYGQPSEALPEAPHRRLIQVVTAASALARSLHIGFSGDADGPPSVEAIARDAGLDPQRVLGVEPSLHEEVARRAEALGLDELVEPDMQMRSIASANAELARLNDAMRAKAQAASRATDALDAIASFQRRAGAGGLIGAFENVGRSARETLGKGFYAVCFQRREGEAWEVSVIGRDDAARCEIIESPDATAATAARLLAGVGGAPPTERLSALPLDGGLGGACALVHDRGALPGGPAMAALAATWGAAIAAAAQHDGARRLQEQIADANRRLSETRERLAESESMARLGRLAAGAAHEMNNPLAIIAGKCQALEKATMSADQRRIATSIREAAQRLNGLINDLHFFASPPAPKRRRCDLTDLLGQVVREIRTARVKQGLSDPPVQLQVAGPLPPAWVDPEHLARAVGELLSNALDAAPRSRVRLRAAVDESGDLAITVEDDGRGMDRETLTKAFDPFFSQREAGRRIGLGLARARRLAERHGGGVTLTSTPGEGTVAEIRLHRWRRSDDEGGRLAAA